MGISCEKTSGQGCPIRCLSLTFDDGFEGVLRDMARREMSLLSSSSSSISPEAAFSYDFLEYLRFQFSRMVALLSFARIKTNDGKDNSDETNNDNKAKPASACDHGLLCR